jgi:hypothetical protein
MKELPKTYKEFLDEIRPEIYFKEDSGKEYIESEWCIGGISGGNCWGGVADTPVSGEPEPEFEYLDSIIETYYPKIGFIQYKRMCQELIVRSERCGYGDYYGNQTDYAVKKVDLKKLYAKLQEWQEE